MIFFVHIKMTYLFNRQKLFQKTRKNRYNCGGKEKAGECYIQNKKVIKENAKNKYKNLSEEEKEAKREYGRNRHKNMKRQAKKFFCTLKNE